MMRSKYSLLLLMAILMLHSTSALSATKDVTISWTMADTTDVTGYKMYYGYNASLSDKQVACETTDQNATSLTCTGIDLIQSPVYFAIAAVLSQSEASSAAVAETFVTGISVVQGFQLVINPDSTSPPEPDFSRSINFQPADADVPDGYVVDSGLGYDSSRGYGWTTGNLSGQTRDRDDDASMDQAYDTMIHVAVGNIWEIAVPNGTYSVTICNGDASWPTGTQNVQAEGTTIIDNVTISSSSPWVERTSTVTVDDGRLTVTFTGSTDPARLCWIKVNSIQ